VTEPPPPATGDWREPDEAGGDALERDEDKPAPARRVAGWQRALRWVAWLSFAGVAIAGSQRPSFGGVELLALAVAIAISVWCLAKPLGGPKVAMSEAADVRGVFVSRTNWALVLFGVALTVAGVGVIAAMVYNLSSGRATIRDVLSDIETFVVGWTYEVFTGWSHNAHLERTHAYALFVLVVPGVFVIWWNLVPFVKRGREFRVDPDASISIHGRRGWVALLEPEYSAVTADGTTIRFMPALDGTPPIVLPQARVFSHETGARLRRDVSAEFFQQRLAGRGFTVEVTDAKRGRLHARRA
jgi:hypothetical protein